MVAWMLGVVAGPRVLAGLGACLRHGPRRHQPPGAKQIAVSNPRFLAAHAACGYLVPNGGQETVAQIQGSHQVAVAANGCQSLLHVNLETIGTG